jgi:RND family efflux transporter MFP subunit
VHAGEPLVTITADSTALQNYQQAVAAFNFAEGELARQRSLFAQRLATNSQVASAERALSDAQIAIETERKLGHDKPTEVAKAPFDGFIAAVVAAPGDRLQSDAPILKLSRTDAGLLVTCGLSPEDAAGVAPGMTAHITPVLWSKAQPIEGTVRQLGASLNPTTKLIDVWIAVKEAAALVPGTTVSAAIVRSQHDGWVVPRNAVLDDQNGSYILQVADGRARRVEVETGVETNQLTEISGDFDPTLRVVATGNYELSDGMAVRETAPAVSMRDASPKGGR